MCIAMCISTHVIKPRFYIKSPHPNAHEGVIKFQISITYIRSMLYLKAYSTGLASLSLCTISTLCLPRAGSLLIYYVNSVLTCTWNYWPSPLSPYTLSICIYGPRWWWVTSLRYSRFSIPPPKENTSSLCYAWKTGSLGQSAILLLITLWKISRHCTNVGSSLASPSFLFSIFLDIQFLRIGGFSYRLLVRTVYSRVVDKTALLKKNISVIIHCCL